MFMKRALTSNPIEKSDKTLDPGQAQGKDPAQNFIGEKKELFLN